MLYLLVTRTEYGFFFEKDIHYIANQFNVFKGALKEVSAVKHNPVQDSLMKYLTQTSFFHLINGTEDGFNVDKCIYSIVYQFYFLKGV